MKALHKLGTDRTGWSKCIRQNKNGGALAEDKLLRGIVHNKQRNTLTLIWDKLLRSTMNSNFFLRIQFQNPLIYNDRYRSLILYSKGSKNGKLESTMVGIVDRWIYSDINRVGFIESSWRVIRINEWRGILFFSAFQKNYLNVQYAPLQIIPVLDLLKNKMW